MSIQGFRTTDNFVTDGRPLNWRAAMLLRYPNGDTPLYALTAALKSEATDDPQYNWWEKPMQTRRFTLGADLNAVAGSQTITLASADIDDIDAQTHLANTLKDGDILLVEHTGEIIYVTDDPVEDSDEITVTRAYAGTVAVTAVDYDGASVNPHLLLIGSAYEEGSDAPDGRAYDPVKKLNYTQIFRNTFEHTRTAAKTRLRTGDDVKEAKRETLELHSRDIEWAFFLGAKKETTKNGKPLRMTGGVKSFIPALNKVAVSSGQLDMATLEGYMERIFKFGSSQKMAFCGPRAMTCLQQVTRLNAAYQIYANEKVLGINVTKVISPHGELNIKRHPMFAQVGGAASGGIGAGQTFYGMDSTMFVLDQSNLRYRYFSGDDTRYEADLQANGIDGEKSGFITECGLEVGLGETHFLITQMNEGIADS